MTADRNLFLQEVIDAIPNPVYYKDIRRGYLGCNTAFKSFFGKQLDEIIGETLLDIMSEKYGGQSAQKDQTIIETGTSVQYETELVRGDGLVRNVFASKAPLSGSDGLLAGVVGSFVDITEQREMDENIRKMSRAIEQSPATIVITNVDGDIEYVNPKFCETTGYSKEEAIGQNPRILKSGEMPPEGYAELWKTLSAGKEWRGEFHNKRKDGTFYWELASISPLADKGGLISGYLAVKEDITERKHMQDALFESEARLHNVVNAAQDAIVMLDTDGAISTWNDSAVRIFGYSAQEAMGRNFHHLIAPERYHKDHFKAFEKFQKTGDGAAIGKIVELSALRKGGEEFPVELALSAVNINDQWQAIGIIRDVSKRKGIEAELAKKQMELEGKHGELEEAYSELKNAQLQIFQQEKMASVGQLAAGVAHEINNPMGYISSNLSTLNKYIDRLAEFITAADQSLIECAGNRESDKLNDVRKRLKIDYITDDARQLIVESQDGASRVRRIVQDLKSFSRVDQVEKAMTNLNEALETIINIAWNEIKYVAEINREFGDIPDILCFPQQLNQVFLNLLINAAHAMEGREGVITVRTWSEADSVFVSVTDTGCGMPEEILKRIFEPFFTTKEVGKGTGLGLSISYEIIRKHGGEITVVSQIGNGTTFVVRLPLSQQQQ